MEPSVARYQYAPLDSSKFQIRLLTINLDIHQVIGRKRAKPITGTLTTHVLPNSTSKRQRALEMAKLPMFYTLSYVWGDPTRTREIFLDGKSLLITENLYQALRGMQREIVSKFKIWADAICINQDDLEERSAQILLMRELYHAGATVRVWLGQTSEDSTRVLKFINSLTGAAATFPEDIKEEDDIMDDVFARGLYVPAEATRQSLFRFARVVQDAGDLLSPTYRDDRAKLLLNPDDNLSLHQDSINDASKWHPSKSRLHKVEYEGDFKEIAELMEKVILQNDWFTRMWVVQELGAASDVAVQIGPVALNWRYIVRALYYLHFTCEIHLPHIRRVIGLEKIRLGWNNGNRQPLRELIRECQYRRATDPRDKVYSLFGMMGDKFSELLQPDYTKAVGEVYANASRHFIAQTESLDILCAWQVLGRSTDPAWDLPSWTPDFTLDQERAPVSLVPIDGEESIFAASGADHRSKYTLPTDETTGAWRTLSTKGMVIDTIDILSIPGDEKQPFNDREKDWLSTIVSTLDLSNEERHALERISEMVQNYHECVGQNRKVVDEKGRFEGATLSIDSILNNSIVNAYLHNLLCGRISSKERLDPDAIEALLNMNNLSSPMPGSFAHKAVAAFNDGIRLRRLVVTKDQHIGAAPFTTEEGDLICILYGCSVPVVLRPSSDGSKTYQFVGECYLHGFMDAEAIVWNIKGKLKEDDFMLI